MSAEVIAYSADPWDHHLTLKWMCLPCSVEGGWSTETAGAYDRVQAMAAAHDTESHPPSRVEWTGRIQVHQPIRPQEAKK
jgi:hypothetical protein